MFTGACPKKTSKRKDFQAKLIKPILVSEALLIHKKMDLSVTMFDVPSAAPNVK